jgi:hypothetical protein
MAPWTRQNLGAFTHSSARWNAGKSYGRVPQFL